MISVKSHCFQNLLFVALIYCLITLTLMPFDRESDKRLNELCQVFLCSVVLELQAFKKGLISKSKQSRFCIPFLTCLQAYQILMQCINMHNKGWKGRSKLPPKTVTPS